MRLKEIEELEPNQRRALTGILEEYMEIKVKSPWVIQRIAEIEKSLTPNETLKENVNDYY